MKNLGLVIVTALLICFAGVSCNGELATAECNLQLAGKGLEISGVTYQYSVKKINGDSTSLVRDWTEFNDLQHLVIENLARGKYTFTVRGISSKSKVTLYEGSTTCYLSSSNQEVIEIVLKDKIDLSKTSTLKINLLNSKISDCTASVVFVEKRTGKVQSADIAKCSSGFSSTYTLTPGYYDVSAFVYQDKVEIGGVFTSVFVPNGYDKTLDLNIEIQKINGTIYDITKNSKITVDVGAKASLAWICKGGSGNFGQWKIDGKTVESKAFHFEIPTSEDSTYEVEYYNGNSVYKCGITVGGKKTKINILNFRSAGLKACIGYKDKSGNPIPLAGKEVSGEGNIFNYEDFNLTPTLVDSIGTSSFAEIYEISDFNTTMYGEDINNPNTTLKVLVTGGDIVCESMSKLIGLETAVLREPGYIEYYAFYGLENLTSVYIFPKSSGTKVYEYAFEGCPNLEHVYVVGSAGTVTFEPGCFDGTKVTKAESITAIL